MLTPGGGFASSLDADSEHEEGKFYVWSEAEIDPVLGDARGAVQALLRRDAGRQLGGPHDPQPPAMPALADDATEAELAACRELLLRARARAGPAGLDDKVLADWNGLMIAAMAEAGIVFERPDWLAIAARRLRFHRDAR